MSERSQGCLVLIYSFRSRSRCGLWKIGNRNVELGNDGPKTQNSGQGVEYPGKIVAAACLIDRSGGRADIGVPLVALATVDFPAYPADALPPELAALPPEKPGSRKAV